MGAQAIPGSCAGAVCCLSLVEFAYVCCLWGRVCFVLGFPLSEKISFSSSSLYNLQN